jgi:hypothetical protein
MSFTLRDPLSTTKTFGVSAQSGTAGGAGDNVELTSPVIDLRPRGQSGFDAAQLVIGYTTTVAATKALNATVKVAESDDGVSFGADQVLANNVTLESGPVTNKVGTYRLDLGVHARKRYIRLKLTLDLTNTASDTFVYGAVVVAQSPDRMPVA